MEPNSFSRYAQGFAPYMDLMRSIVLPPRGKVGSRANKQRARILQAALHQFKYPHGVGCPLRKIKARYPLCRVKVTHAKSRTAP